MQAGGRHRVADAGADRGHRGGGAVLLGRSGRAQRQALQQVAPGRAVGLDEEAGVELGQQDVVAALDLGTGAHRGAEAGRCRGRALHRDHEHLLTAGDVVRVDERRAGEDRVLHAECREIAGAGAQEGDRPGVGRLRGEGHLVAIAGRPGERDEGREGPLLPGRGPDDVPEDVLVAPPAQAVAAGCLLVADAAGQVLDGRDLVEDDRPVGDGGSDDPATVGLAESRSGPGGRGGPGSRAPPGRGGAPGRGAGASPRPDLFGDEQVEQLDARGVEAARDRDEDARVERLGQLAVLRQRGPEGGAPSKTIASIGSSAIPVDVALYGGTSADQR